MNHVTYLNESCHTQDEHAAVTESCRLYEGVMSHAGRLRSCNWVMSHIWRSHVTHRTTSLPQMNNVAYMNESCRTQVWVMSHMPTCHVAWRMDEGIMAYVKRRVAFVRKSCRTVDESCHTQGKELAANHVTYVNESCHTCEWIVSHMWIYHVTHVNISCHTCEWITSHMWMDHVTRTLWMSHATHRANS